MAAVLIFDPLEIILGIFNDLNLEHEVEIFWVQGMKQDPEMNAWGVTEFPDDKSLPIAISLDVDCPLAGLVEILAHELAHVIAGTTHDDETGHGAAWEAAFESIHSEYENIVSNLSEERDVI